MTNSTKDSLELAYQRSVLDIIKKLHLVALEDDPGAKNKMLTRISLELLKQIDI